MKGCIHLTRMRAICKSEGFFLRNRGEDRVVAYASRLLYKQEQNYCVTRKELLAVVYFTKYFKQYLLGQRFFIRTDHAALQWLNKTPEAIGQQARWLEQLEAYQYEIVHRAGHLHGNADAMSRGPCKQCKRHDSDDSGEISPFDNPTAYFSEHTGDG